MEIEITIRGWENENLEGMQRYVESIFLEKGFPVDRRVEERKRIVKFTCGSLLIRRAVKEKSLLLSLCSTKELREQE